MSGQIKLDTIYKAVLEIAAKQGTIAGEVKGLSDRYIKNGFLGDMKEMQKTITEVKTKIDTHIKLTRTHVKRKWRIRELILAICAICLPLSVSIIALIIAV